jgi:hypothetical protein
VRGYSNAVVPSSAEVLIFALVETASGEQLSRGA